MDYINYIPYPQPNELFSWRCDSNPRKDKGTTSFCTFKLKAEFIKWELDFLSTGDGETYTLFDIRVNGKSFLAIDKNCFRCPGVFKEYFSLKNIEFISESSRNKIHFLFDVSREYRDEEANISVADLNTDVTFYINLIFEKDKTTWNCDYIETSKCSYCGSEIKEHAIEKCDSCNKPVCEKCLSELEIYRTGKAIVCRECLEVNYLRKDDTPSNRIDDIVKEQAKKYAREAPAKRKLKRSANPKKRTLITDDLKIDE